jgi:hypothetical protein
MPTIVVETGAIIDGANSYVSEAEFATYLSDRSITLTGNAALRLIQAMDYLESLSYKGTKKTSGQPLQWPRYCVTIDGWYSESNTIPKELKKAQMAIAVSVDEGNDPLSPIERATKREQVGPISVEYADSASSSTIVKSIPASLWKLVSGGRMLRVSKA